MSIINELKLDFKKDKVKSFFMNNMGAITALVLFVFVLFFSIMFVNAYKNSKIKNYSGKIFLALNSVDKVGELEKIYGDDGAPRISKTFAGMKLVEEYKNSNNFSKVEDIYGEIFENEKEIFFKNYAGLNLLSMEINTDKMNIDKINKLFSKLENVKNPLYDMVLEQKIIFLMRQDKKDEAKTLVGGLLRKNSNSKNMQDRLNKYLDILK